MTCNGTAKPIRQTPRRLPLGKREIEKADIDNMLDRKVIEPSKSPWSSPVVLVEGLLANPKGVTRN
jgi:hypothetical protein